LLEVVSLSVILIVMIIPAAFIVSGMFVSPIERLHDAVLHISEGTLEYKSDIKTGDEIEDLSLSFEKMVSNIKNKQGQLIQAKTKLEESARDLEKKVEERTRDLKKAYDKLKNTQAQLVQAEKLSGIGRLASGVAHELNSPLTGLLALLRSYIRDRKKGSKEYKEAEAMLKASEHMADIVSDLTSFAREPKGGEISDLDLREVIESTLSFSRPQLVRRNIRVTELYEDGMLRVRGIGNQLRQVVLNIINNAKAAMPEGGELKISTRLSEDGSRAVMEFSDTGTGIRDDDLEKIFDPFFTTKGPGEGTGLGLSVSHGIVKAHGGDISAESEPGEGAKFTVSLPAL
jgi:two-component system NtrC family sensor kinase